MRKAQEVNCARAQGLMSPYIDSMATPRETECLELHLSACRGCQRQLQSLISMRGLLARMEKPGLPQDLMLEARVRLSRERNRNILVKLETRLSNLLRPIALPAVFGASLTMLFFGILLGCFASNETALAQTRINDEPVFSLYKPVRTTDQTMIRFAASHNQTWDEPLMIETDVGNDGRVTDYRIISGPQNDEVNRWIREVLSLAQFTPAIAFGEPVESKIILSFVAVRS